MNNQLKDSIDQQLTSASLDPWRQILTDWQHSAAGRSVHNQLQARLDQGVIIYPDRPFRALEMMIPSQVKVVILGQDPYHGPGQAEGLCFSVAKGIAIPRSLRNIYKELQRSLDIPMPMNGSLMSWAEQGVLLLNTSLTVEDGQPNCHAKWGWHDLTGKIIEQIGQNGDRVVFMLWGGHAQSHRHLISAERNHLVLESNHPSPLSATKGATPFIDNNHFVKVNEFFKLHGFSPIDWTVH